MLLSMTSNRLDSIVQLITAVCIFIFVLALAYFTTKFTAGFQKSKLAKKVKDCFVCLCSIS